jgi:LPXTG-motif cell wall-anchored protein
MMEINKPLQWQLGPLQVHPLPDGSMTFTYIFVGGVGIIILVAIILLYLTKKRKNAYIDEEEGE